MGDHRADRRGPSRRRSDSPTPEVGPRRRAETAGRRRAAKATRGPLFRGLPSAPIMLGIAALAVSAAGGVVTSGDASLVGSGIRDKGVAAVSALNGTSATSTSDLLSDRRAAVSRDSRRDALADAATAELVEAAERQEEQRNAALALFAKQAEQQAAKLKLNQWVLPVDSVAITAEFGEYGLWASYHTGIDFNGDSGDAIYSVAAGVVTSVGYDGAYGNKTVVTLDDGTEIWYCHQTDFNVAEGEVVSPGDLIGTIGTTGNVTGSHLHLEVRPGGGDPVDPHAAFAVHGLAF